MSDFSIAHKLTQNFEGGFSQDINDKGGLSYRGVSSISWPIWPGFSIIAQYQKVAHLNNGDYVPLAWKRGQELSDLVDAFYLKNFWNANRLGEINNQNIANEMFDTSVNMGTGVAAKFLQKALNLLNRNQKDYQDIQEDGAIGPITLGLVNKYSYPNVIAKTLNGLQFMKYVEICENDPSQEVFFRGWLTRVSFT